MAGRSISFDSCVRGHHVYKNIWTPVIGQTLLAIPEFGNVHDPYAVAMVSSTDTDTVLGHLPRNISTLSHIFRLRNGSIIVQITGERRRSIDLPQGGVEVPCLLLFSGVEKYLEKIEKLLQGSLPPLTPALEPPKKKRTDIVDLCDLPPNETNCAVDHLQKIWLRFDGVCLTEEDKVNLVQGKKLNDRHINYAQRILHSQFPDIDGLGHTILQRRKPAKAIQHGLQIIHDRGDHWVVAVRNIGCQNNIIKLFDSVYHCVDDNTRQVCLNLFDASPSDHDPPASVIEMGDPMCKQVLPNQCGTLAIAVATNLLHGFPVDDINETHARNHVLSCFQSKKLTHFPTISSLINCNDISVQ